jgi:hypothetical protein
MAWSEAEIYGLHTATTSRRRVCVNVALAGEGGLPNVLHRVPYAASTAAVAIDRGERFRPKNDPALALMRDVARAKKQAADGNGKGKGKGKRRDAFGWLRAHGFTDRRTLFPTAMRDFYQLRRRLKRRALATWRRFAVAAAMIAVTQAVWRGRCVRRFLAARVHLHAAATAIQARYRSHYYRTWLRYALEWRRRMAIRIEAAWRGRWSRYQTTVLVRARYRTGHVALSRKRAAWEAHVIARTRAAAASTIAEGHRQSVLRAKGEAEARKIALVRSLEKGGGMAGEARAQLLYERTVEAAYGAAREEVLRARAEDARTRAARGKLVHHVMSRRRRELAARTAAREAAEEWEAGAALREREKAYQMAAVGAARDARARARELLQGGAERGNKGQKRERGALKARWAAERKRLGAEDPDWQGAEYVHLTSGVSVFCLA